MSASRKKADAQILVMVPFGMVLNAYAREKAAHIIRIRESSVIMSSIRAAVDRNMTASLVKLIIQQHADANLHVPGQEKYA